jgi:hypothetical protein
MVELTNGLHLETNIQTQQTFKEVPPMLTTKHKFPAMILLINDNLLQDLELRN